MCCCGFSCNFFGVWCGGQKMRYCGWKISMKKRSTVDQNNNDTMPSPKVAVSAHQKIKTAQNCQHKITYKKISATQ
jgi:DNA-directed RNA polymerase subunit RPC12/RpoP